MPIPDILLSQIKDGNAVLVLGAGASIGATNPNGNHMPKGKELGEILSDNFLGGKYKDSPLAHIAEYAISESDLITVQTFLRDYFENFEPTEAHKRLCLFRWLGLATTNYDLLIEKAYKTVHGAVQKPEPFIENGDRVVQSMRDPRCVMLLKLHGCITRITNEKCKLILTPDHYASYLQGRDRIFNHLQNWAIEKPIIFIGQSLEDPDLRAVLAQLELLGECRPRYYFVSPDMDEIRSRLWEKKKISPLIYTFHDFMCELEKSIPKLQRGLAAVRPSGAQQHPIMQRFKTNNIVLSPTCMQFLSTDAEYVNAITATNNVNPKDFYKGMDTGWSAIEQKLDVPRHLADTIVTDHVLTNSHSDRPEILLIKAHAGAGKSILLKRLAWDIAKSYENISLFVKPHGIITSLPLQEIINNCNDRVFLFIDDAAERIREIQALVRNIGPEGKLLTIIMAERINEWNVLENSIESLITTPYELKYLSTKEIGLLISLLEVHNALGELTHCSNEERLASFEEKAGRQLLVALHEVTLGRKFEDIIEDEYNNIQPIDAQKMYLTICVLNRLGVPVRAGIIARIHGIPFTDFEKRLFKPLEHVVHTEYDAVTRDYMYRARHKQIAEMVFQRILRKQEERYDAYLRCLRELNIDYDSDKSAFRKMIRGRVIVDMFPDHELATRIYDIAQHITQNDAYSLQQKAIYEMNRPNANLTEAAILLENAYRLQPNDDTVKHSIAENLLKRAESARTTLERSKLFDDASKICASLKTSTTRSSYPFHTMVKIGIMKLKDACSEIPLSDEVIKSLLKDVENNLFEGLQKYPGDPYLLTAESELAKVIADSDRAITALSKAFKANPRIAFLAIRLAHYYENSGRNDLASNILIQALDANPGDKRLHYAYAKLLLAKSDTGDTALLHHLNRAYTDGDSNYDAQLLHARQLFIMRDYEGSKKAFTVLSKAKIDPATKSKPLYLLSHKFKGIIDRVEASYAWIKRDGDGQWIYLSRDYVTNFDWQLLEHGSKVFFKIGFNFMGPTALEFTRE